MKSISSSSPAFKKRRQGGLQQLLLRRLPHTAPPHGAGKRDVLQPLRTRHSTVMKLPEKALAFFCFAVYHSFCENARISLKFRLGEAVSCTSGNIAAPETTL
ncbi:MAG: hypothetical protein KH614_07090 [Firmicutes bacterium]|nr:hypothetical protein [Bacillota bacterium]